MTKPLGSLYHFQKPQSLKEANEWLWNYLTSYNALPHRSDERSRLEDWKQHLPSEGYRQMCSWERFTQISREPSERRVGSDACLTVEGVSYQLKADMAGERVTVLLGLFDQEIFVDFRGEKEGPFYPAAGPIPLHTYRSLKKTEQEKKIDALGDLAKRLSLPRSVLSGRADDEETAHLIKQAHLVEEEILLCVPFRDQDIKERESFKPSLEAKLAIASYLGRPLATLSAEQCHQIDRLIAQTLHKEKLLSQVRSYFQPRLYQATGG